MEEMQTIVKMVLDRWKSLLAIFDTKLKGFTDEELLQEIAPGKNRGIYILGHLIAVHDAMLPLLNLGEQQHPQFFEIFVTLPDKSIAVIPAPGELRMIWKSQVEMLTDKLETFSTEEWFTKHNSVSADEFKTEPHRNKLNILLTRTTHLAYHTGQVALLN